MPNPLSLVPRVYYSSPLSLSGSGECELPTAVAHHLLRVLRLRVGDEVRVFDGTGGEWRAQLLAADKRSARIALIEHLAVERESALPVTLVQCLQGGDKMDLTVQKAVELGVSRLVPIMSQRSVVRLDGERADRRRERWQEIAVSACEQCGRNRVPEIAPVTSLGQWLASVPKVAAGSLRLILSPDGATGLAQLPEPSGLEVLIGPEGGLATEEEGLARAAGYQPIRLGPRVLRTETAGLAILAAAHARWGDFR